MGKMQKVRTGAGTVGIEQIFTPNEFELRFIIEPQISPYGGPLFFALSLGSAVGNVVANGSYGLLDTGKKKLLVTCCHVWDDYQNLRKSDSELKMLICLDRKPPVVLNSIVPIDQDANWILQLLMQTRFKGHVVIVSFIRWIGIHLLAFRKEKNSRLSVIRGGSVQKPILACILERSHTG